ncbi:snRNA-activating protein complex subunit 2 isoform X3 [Carettochelys insculpta]|uniref:snRNA-activating protein complex subunit 2 isoform X3 n=1 Tax=Carettochelys insculpta TaxID=44489 RepID=UPI003EB86A91
MKPPVRTRSAPSRYETGPSAKHAPTQLPWTVGEKRCLIRALKAQTPHGELQAELLQEYLPRRTAAEILAFVHQLKGRVAREAVQTEYRRCREAQRHKRAEILAPIEVLTVAVTEPVTLLHSLPRKLTRAAEKKALPDALTQRDALPALDDAAGNAAASPECPAAVEPPSIGTEPGAQDEPETFSVDFEKIYKYLSLLSRDMKVPELSPYESAVLLDLLMSLPEEISELDYAALKRHMDRSYRELTAQQPEGSRNGLDPGASAGEQVADAPPASIGSVRPPPGNPSVSCPDPVELAEASDSQERPSRSAEAEQGTQDTSLPSEHPSPAQHSASLGQLPPPLHSPPEAAAAQKPVWKELGVCPLNLFLLPLELLARKGDSLD